MRAAQIGFHNLALILANTGLTGIGTITLVCIVAYGTIKALHKREKLPLDSRVYKRVKDSKGP
jgi:hypothetical protein